MISISNIDTWGFEHALRGMRNPLSSWDKSDSVIYGEKISIGPKDLDLMKRLCAAGPEHRKYLRQIFVSMDIVAPMYWWNQFDTYKIGTAANSTSKMHTLTKDRIALADFSIDDYEMAGEYKDAFKNVVDDCEALRKAYVATKDEQYWRWLIQLLPESFNYLRTVTMNYENVINIIHQREHHKLKEWNDFIEVLKELPYIKEITNE